VSDTSLVFNLIGRDKVSGVLGAIKGSFKSTGTAAESSMDKASKSVQKLERELDKAERKLEQLDESAARAAFAQEAAQAKLGAAQAKYNSLVEKGSALQTERIAATERVSAAEEKVAATSQKSASEQKAALAELEAAKGRLASLDAKEGSLADQKVQALARVRAAEISVADAADRAGRADSRRSRAVSDIDRLGRAFTDAKSKVEGLGDGGDRTEGRMRSLFSAIGDGASAAGQFGSMVSSATSSIWGITAALLAMAAAAFAIGPGLSIAGAALGSLPGLIAGGAAAAGTLKLGLFGLSDEYARLTKVTGGGGGGAAKAQKDFTAATRAVEQAVEGLSRAERDVTTAQADALAAQKAINDAREQAADRLRDQALDLKDAQLSQADAADAVTEAQGQLNIAIASGDPIQIKKAQRAYDEAVVAAERAKNRVDDLTEANAKNAKTGVEGSDEVVQAKKREQDARQRVADAIQAERDAEERLADARKSLADQKSAPAGGGGGGAAQKITKLAPAARDFLNVILGLRPAMEHLRLDVQQHLFAGLADKLQHLADVWKGPATKTLTSWADTFNGIAKTVFGAVSKKSFIDDITSAADSARKALAPVGHAMGPLIDAFGRLARASGPFLEKVGTLLGGALEKFSAWIKKADETGDLKEFFSEAANTLGKVWKLLGNVMTVGGKVLAIFFPDSVLSGNSVLDSLNNGLSSVSKWLDDPENQQNIFDFVYGFTAIAYGAWDAAKVIWDFGKKVYAVLKQMNRDFSAAQKWTSNLWSSIKNGVSSAYNWVVTKGNAIVGWVKALPGRISKAAVGMWDGIKNSFRGAMNWIIGKWNRLSFSLPSVSTPFGTIGGQSLETPDIKYLAKGGTIDQSGLAMVGDAGPELLNLPRGAQVTPLAAMQGGGREDVLVIDVRGADNEFGRLLVKVLRENPATSATVKKHLKIVTS
jgi:hypothetical protein